VTSILLGHAENRRRVEIDLDVLLRTRLLVQANSGGGKSWLIRLLAEKLYRKIPVFLIDPEGEFATLREKYGYVLVGNGGETPADPRSAALVAERLLQLRASAVCDLYEAFRARPSDRRLWVRRFLEAIIDAPKDLWRPLVVIVDEAHKFCPQETPKAGSPGEREAILGCKEAMISLATTGRKRGFCSVWATQRLAKLDKDASAELLNRLIGPTFEDVDIDRAVDLLSVSREDRHEFKKRIRVLEPGHFFAIGRAVSTERVMLVVGPVETTHPEMGSTTYSQEPPPTPEKVKALLPKLSDLPKEAEDRARSEAELRAENRTLKAQLKQAEKAQPVPAPKSDARLPGLVKALKAALEDAVRFIIHINAQDFFGRAGESVDQAAIQQAIDGAVQASLRLLEGKIEQRHKEFERLRKDAGRVLTRLQAALDGDVDVQVDVKHNPPFTVAPAVAARREIPRGSPAATNLGKGEARILTAVAQYPEGATREQLTILTGYRRSSRDTYLQRLRSGGLVEDRGRMIVATAAGLASLGPEFEPLPTGEALREHWMRRLPEGERRILGVLIGAHPKAVFREEIDTATGYKRSSRDTYLQRLSARRLWEPSAGKVRAAGVLFEEG